MERRQLTMLGVCSGVKEGRLRAGAAIIMSERLGRCLREYKCVNERILRIRLNDRRCMVHTEKPSCAN